jgi:hypothetical protein
MRFIKVTTEEQQSNTDNNITSKQEEQYRIAKDKPTSLLDVRLYFEELKEPGQAESFFDYFESNGWKVGGKAPMKNWKASARNWIRNSKKWSNNGSNTNSIKKSDATRRAEFRHTEDQLQDTSFVESLKQRDRERGNGL